jgi:hypothetical protein
MYVPCFARSIFCKIKTTDLDQAFLYTVVACLLNQQEPKSNSPDNY